MIKFSTFRLTYVALVLGLSGCAVEPATQAILDSYKVVRADGTVAAGRGLNPDYRYLRVQVGDRELFMAQGYLDPSPAGPVEVWYSADHNVLRIRDGRLVGLTMKSGVEWLNVTFSHLPAWSQLGESADFERRRDVGPGYRYGIVEKMHIRRIAAPENSSLKAIPASTLIWFEETVQGGAGHPARYAVNDASHRVVYAEQCLSDEFCLSWQDWPHPSKDAH